MGMNPQCSLGFYVQNSVLSSADCFSTPSAKFSNITILAGSVNSDTPAQRHLLDEVIVHPDYNNLTYDSDIAILKLASLLIFNNDVQPACLPDHSFTPEETEEIS